MAIWKDLLAVAAVLDEIILRVHKTKEFSLYLFGYTLLLIRKIYKDLRFYLKISTGQRSAQVSLTGLQPCISPEGR